NTVDTYLKPVAEELGLTVAAVAIRWILTHPAVSCAIVGIKKPQHIETVVSAADGILDRQLWHEIAAKMAGVVNN
ncbi:MAG: aldo/keto reductase, partial [Candidatus Omnitrophica bacterium]|nr:aldo/keto reductase [Candidatus Omnitrophota bacterium]